MSIDLEPCQTSMLELLFESQSAFASSKLKIKTLEQGVKHA